MWATVLKNLVYPLAIKLAGWIWNKYLVYEAEESKKEIDKQRAALNKAIERAENDDEINSLSMVLHKLDRM